MRTPCLLLLLCCSIHSGWAALTTYNFDSSLVIPDGSANGVSDTRTIGTPETEIDSLRVALTISGLFDGAINGDFFVRLLHVPSGNFAVLLNRVGRREGVERGYTDNGFNHLTLSDSASQGDVHTYRQTLAGSHDTPIAGPLTGLWQPDARVTTPDGTGTLATPRTVFLDSFEGIDPNGEWTLFVADLATGGTARLDSWSLEIAAVPEPTSCGLICAVLLGSAVFHRLRQKRGKKRSPSSPAR